MDILKILKESYAEMYPEDFEFLETELATGSYEPEYVKMCREQMEAIRNATNGGAQLPASEAAFPETVPAAEQPKETGNQNQNTDSNAAAAAVSQEPEKKLLSPEMVMTETNGFEAKQEPEFAEIPVLVSLTRDLRRMRSQRAYLPDFKKYIKANSAIFTPEFLDANFSLLLQPEMDAVIMNFQMGEEFLEKYFGALDHDKIARYQLFSESFFIKHYAQMNPEIVLRHGKNEWRPKEKRSQKLGVFLRLKGIQY